jgi:hypothetical protein
MDELELFKRLGVALAAGMLIGLERGWHERAMPEGSRVAGIRTFAIVGLLGGLWALLGELVGEIALGFAFLAFAVVMIIARVRAAAKIDDYGITTVVAALVTFALGAIALRGQLSIAAAGAVVTALLLGIKPALHEFVERIEPEELNAVLKLLLMTIVLLPVLPDRGFGPWKALNPYELWWMVVLIATMHFVGYVAVKLVGEQRGIPLAGLAGGLIASTAVAVSFSRRASYWLRRRCSCGSSLSSVSSNQSSLPYSSGRLAAPLLPRSGRRFFYGVTRSRRPRTSRKPSLAIRSSSGWRSNSACFWHS